MVEVTVERRVARRPARARMMHPFVEEAALVRLEEHAKLLRVHPDQLAAFILEQVIADVAVSRRIGI